MDDTTNTGGAEPLVQPDPDNAPDGSKKIVAGVLGILLGSLGIHKFYLGYTKEGLIMLLVSVIGGIISCGIVTSVVGVVGLVEGIIYLTKPDEEFHNIYVAGRRPWF